MLTARIMKGILSWAAEVGVLLDACRKVVEYYGNEEEATSVHEGLKAPLWFIEALKQIASGTEVDTTKAPPLSKFACSEALATMVTPLLRIVVERKPDFVADAFEALDEHTRNRVTVPYGQFLGTAAMYLCDPLWTSYPHLAPPGWQPAHRKPEFQGAGAGQIGDPKPSG